MPIENTELVGTVPLIYEEPLCDAPVPSNSKIFVPIDSCQTTQPLVEFNRFVIKIFGTVDNPCFTEPLLPVPVYETMENPEASDTLPALSIVPIPV